MPPPKRLYFSLCLCPCISALTLPCCHKDSCDHIVLTRVTHDGLLSQCVNVLSLQSLFCCSKNHILKGQLGIKMGTSWGRLPCAYHTERLCPLALWEWSGNSASPGDRRDFYFTFVSFASAHCMYVDLCMCVQGTRLSEYVHVHIYVEARGHPLALVSRYQPSLRQGLSHWSGICQRGLAA